MIPIKELERLKDEFDIVRPLEELLTEPVSKGGLELVLRPNKTGTLHGVIKQDGEDVRLTDTETLYMKAFMTYEVLSVADLITMIHGEFCNPGTARVYISRLNKKIGGQPITNLMGRSGTKAIYYLNENPDLSEYNITYGDYTLNTLSRNLTFGDRTEYLNPQEAIVMEILLRSPNGSATRITIEDEFRRRRNDLAWKGIKDPHLDILVYQINPKLGKGNINRDNRGSYILYHLEAP